MAYQKKVWKNRLSEFPNRRRLEPTGIENTYDVVRAEGNVPEPGDAFAEDSMNDLEERIAAGIAESGVSDVERATWNGKATATTYSATLTTTGWSASAPYTQTVTVSGLLATDNPIADVLLSGTTATAQAQLEAWGCVGRMVAAANSFTAYCYESKPTTAIPLQFKVVR